MTATLDRVRVRFSELDRVRGLAVALMILDHLLLVLGTGAPVRATLTRAAMPLFFLLAGGLAMHVRPWRLYGIALLGVLLPVAVPFIDSPNVLAVYVVGVLVCALCPRWVQLLVVVAALGLYANRYALGWAHAYEPAALLGLMALGRLYGVEWAFWLGRHLPRFLAGLGRYPLTVYVGHLLLLLPFWAVLHG